MSRIVYLGLSLALGIVAVALAVFKRFCFPHTWANKLTGLLLFLEAPTAFWSMILVAIVAAIATFAVIQEGHFIRTKQVF